MILEQTTYRVICDDCHAMLIHTASDIGTIEKVLIREGWWLNNDIVICSKCVKKRCERTMEADG